MTFITRITRIRQIIIMKLKEKMIELFASDYGPLMQSDDCLVQVMRKTQDRSELLSLCISESFNHLLINEKQVSQNAKRNAQRRVRFGNIGFLAYFCQTAQWTSKIPLRL